MQNSTNGTEDKMKFLVLGATGMAGHTIALYLLEHGHEVTSFSRAPFPFCENINGDLLDQKFLKTILLKNDYDVVINCIGLLNHYCDENRANSVYLNSYLPHELANILHGKYTKLIHMSTDCVFSGKSAPYYENSFPNGETFYDRTKALGEIEDTKNLTFRNSIIGPDMNPKGIGLFNWFMKQKGIINGYTGAIWTGVTTLTLAKAMERAALENLSGLYHLVNNNSIKKFELLKLFKKHFNTEVDEIFPDHSVQINKTLINTRTDFTFNVPSYETMIIEMKDWIVTHKELYPHYSTRI